MSMRDGSATLSLPAADVSYRVQTLTAPAEQPCEEPAAPAQPAESLIETVQRVFGDAALRALLGRDGEPMPLAALRHTTLRPAADFLRRPGKGFRATLVELGWQLAGGTERPPAALAHLVELIHAGSMIVDDIEDGSTHRRGAPALHEVYGAPLALNTGNLLYFLPFALLDELQLAAPVALDLHRRLSRTMLRAHFGQALDLGTSAALLPRAEVECVVRAISELKTGSLMELAASIGAVALGAAGRAGALAQFGAAFGVALQMLDDLGNLDGGRDPHKRYEDLQLGRPTWVWAWLAADLAGPAFAALQTQAAAVRAGAAPEPLAERLRAALGDAGRRRARVQVRGALAELRRALGRHPALYVLERECARLVVSYG